MKTVLTNVKWHKVARLDEHNTKKWSGGRPLLVGADARAPCPPKSGHNGCIEGFNEQSTCRIKCLFSIDEMFNKYSNTAIIIGRALTLDSVERMTEAENEIHT